MKKKLSTPFQTRQYMLSEDFELYYYEDTNLMNVKPHRHDYYEFYFFRQGDITMYINDRPFLLNPGDVILIPPGVSHYIENRNEANPYKRLIFWISKNYYHSLIASSSDYGYIMSYSEQNNKYVYHIDTTNFHTLQLAHWRMLEEIHSNHFGRENQIRLYADTLLLTLNRLVYEQNSKGLSDKKIPLYESLILYIESHIDEDLSLEHLSDVLFFSKYHIAHCFKEHLGISIHSYITKKRLALCCEALLNQDNISKVYPSYGFKDYSAFYRAFKKEYGISPAEYKAEHAKSDLL